MDYKVCIMAAGKGTRISYAEGFNKAILPVGEKSVLSRIVDKFPKNIEVVIAVGHNAHLIKDFVAAAYPDRKITLVDIAPYQGPGSGPGFSLYSCRQYLQCPFIFTSADTIVLENVPEPNRNWIGVAHASNPEEFCMVDTHEGLAKAFYIKMPMAELLKRVPHSRDLLNNAFIGMAGVYDYQDFWKGFTKEHERVQGEVQVMDGLEELVPKKLHTHAFTWFDTGNDVNYYHAQRHFSKHNLLSKPQEFIFFEGNRVIKYFADSEVVKKRARRARMLSGVVPKIIFESENFYAYEYKKGRLLSQVHDGEIFKNFLNFCKEKLWLPKNLETEKKQDFLARTKRFYLDKTHDRLSKFYSDTGIKDREEKINGLKHKPLAKLLEQIDWSELTQGVPTHFHGDLQPENVLVTDRDFHLLDWRHEFDGLTEYGDIYYDFAKLYHALIISQEIIRKNEFEIKVDEREGIRYNFLIKNNLLNFKDEFEKFIIRQGYSLNKVRILSGLIYLNIAPMHHYPYNILLYYFGRDYLNKVINNP